MSKLCLLISQMLWRCVEIQAWVTNLQTGWRAFFAWLMQRLQSSDTADTSKVPRPANPDSIMTILSQWQCGGDRRDIFSFQV